MIDSGSRRANRDRKVIVVPLSIDDLRLTIDDLTQSAIGPSLIVNRPSSIDNRQSMVESSYEIFSLDLEERLAQQTPLLADGAQPGGLALFADDAAHRAFRTASRLRRPVKRFAPCKPPCSFLHQPAAHFVPGEN